MSDNETIAEKLKRAAQNAKSAAEEKDAPAADPLSFETIKEKADAQRIIYQDHFFMMATPALTWAKEKANKAYENSGSFRRAYDVVDVTWNYGLKQVFWLASLPANKIIRPLHNKIFPIAAFGKDEETGDRTQYNRFRYTMARIGVSLPAIVGASLSFYAAASVVVKTPYYVGDFLYDGAMMTVFSRDEEAIVGKPSELKQTFWGVDYYNVPVCLKPCNGENDNTTYRIVPNTVLNVGEALKNWHNVLGFLGIGELKLRTIVEIQDEAAFAENDCKLKVFGTRNDVGFLGLGGEREPKIYNMSCQQVKLRAPEL